MKLSLVVLSEGKANGQRIPVTLSQFVIGRDPQCNLKPASPMISKRHCGLLVKDGQVWIRDFNSSNGTFVNDEQVKGQRRLQNDDVLKIGPLQFRLVIEAPTPVNKATPIPPKAKANKGGEEDVADMLLSLGDDADAAPMESASDQEVSSSTVMDIPAFNPAAPPPEAAKVPEEPKKPEPKKEEKKPSAQQSTAAAAKAILEKYTKRQR